MIKNIKNISLENKIYIALIILLSVCSIIPIWIVEYFPSQNGPAFLNIIHMFKEMNNPEYGYNEYFMRHLHYMPYLSFYAMIFILSSLLPLLIAQKTVLSFIVLCFPASIFYYLIKTDPKKIIFGFPVYLMIYNYLFMRSYNNFMIAVILFFAFLGYWQSVKHELNRNRLIILNIFLLLIYVSHIIVLSFLLFILFLIQLLEGRSFAHSIKHLLKISVPILISFSYFFYFTITNSIWQKESMQIFNWLDKTQDLYYRFWWPYSNFGKIISIIPIFIVLITIVKKKGDIFSRYVSKNKITIYNSVENRNVFLIFTALFVYYLTPWEVFGWHKADVRFIPFLLIFILSCAQPFKEKFKRISFVLMTSVFAMLLFAQVGYQAIQLDDVIKNEYLSGMDHVKKNKKLLPINVSKPLFRFVSPLAHAFNYYGIYRGSITGMSLAKFNTISPVWYKDYKEFPDFSKLPVFKADALNPENLEIIKKTYDYVLLWGNDKKTEYKFENNEFRLVFKKKRLHIFENNRLQQVN